MKIIKRIIKWCSKTKLRKILSLILVILIFFTSIKYVFFSPTKLQAAWLNDSWSFRLKITIDAGKVDADLTDFPVYVDLSLLPLSFHNHVNQTDARDIRVTKSDGLTELPREVVFYNSSANTGELHFKYSGTLSGTNNTEVFIYFGNPNASDYASTDTYGRNNVWDSNYKGVWHLTESTGQHADSTVNGNDSVSVAVTVQGTANAKIGGADDFDATDDVINLGTDTSLDLNVNGTIESWIYPNGWGEGGLGTLIFRGAGSSVGYNVYTRGASTNLAIWDGVSVQSPTISLDTWTHTASVIEGSNMIFYTNGAADAGHSWTVASTGVDTAYIGSNNGIETFDGQIDEFRISDIARSATWLSTQYNNQNSPVTFFTSSSVEEQKGKASLNFTFDEGYGTTAHDSSPNGYVGTLSGTTTPTWQFEDMCISDKCLYYEGTTAYTAVSTSVPNIQSISFWVKPKTNSESLMDFDGGTHRITASSGTISATGFSTPTIYVNGISGAPLVANAWQHVEVTTATSFTGSAITIGKYSTNFLNGFIDEFKIYDYARSAAQIKLDYNSRNSQSGAAVRFGPDNGNILSNGLIGYWNMELSTTAASGYPTVADKGTAYQSSDPGTTTHAIDMPSNISVGDLLVIVGGVDGASGTFTWPGDWNQLYLTAAGGSASHRGFGGYKIADGSETATMTITTATENLAATVWRINNWHGTTPPEIATATGNDVSPDSPNLTPSWGAANTLWISHTAWNPTGTLSSYPANYTSNQESYTAGSAGASRYAAASRESNSASENPGAYTLGTTSGWSAHTIGIRPSSGSSTNLLDVSGNSITLTNNGTTTFVSGKYGYGSEHVPASTQYLSTASTINGVKSVSFWVNPDSNSNYYLSLTSGAYITSTTGTLSATGFTDPKIYVNGIETSTVTANVWQFVTVTSDTSINADQFYIGRQGSNYFDGTMDEVRLYNRKLPISEVAILYNFAAKPVGYWNMDENTGSTTVYDVSGNGNTGTVSNFTNWRNGKFGSALEFNNSNSIVNTGSGSKLDNLKNTGMTAEAWIFPRSSNANGSRIFDKGSTGATNRWIFSITGSASALTFQHTCTPTSDLIVTTNNILTMNTWNHVAVSWTGSTSGSTVTFYLNGVAVQASSTTDCNNTLADDSANNLSIGDTNDSGTRRPFDGYIDEAKIYNYVRSPAQVVEDMNGGHSAPGSPIGSSVAYWKFDEGYGTTANDSSINGNSLTLSASSWSNNGKLGKAFNGLTNVRLSRTTDSDLEFSATDDFTISLWYKSDSATNPGAIEYLVNDGAAAGSAGYAIYANTSGNICFGIDDDTSWGPDVDSCTTTDVYDNTWHHVVAVRNVTSDTTKIYLDSIERDSDSDSTTATLDSSPTFYIGDANGTDGTDEFLGDIDEVKIYRSALSVDQIKLLYNNGANADMGNLSTDASNIASNSNVNSYCPPGQGSSCTGPVAEWKLDENTGTTANDTSGNGNTGTITTGVGGWVNGKNGSGFNFDALATNINAGSATSIDNLPQSSGLSISTWLYIRSNGEGNAARIAQKDDGNDNPQVGWQYNLDSSNRFTFRAGFTDGTPTEPDMQVVTTNTFTANTWQHVELTWDGSATASNVHIYINGIEAAYTTQTNGTGSYASDASNVLYIGNSSTSARTFDGYIDDVRLYGYARTPAQVAWDFNKGEPVGWWKLDECTGTTINDSIGNNTAGTIVPGASGNTSAGTCSSGTSTEMWNDGTTGKYNGSLGFDSTDDAVTIPNGTSNNFNGKTSITMSAWIKATDAGENSRGRIVDKDGAINGYQMYVTDTGNIGFAIDTATGDYLEAVTTSNLITFGVWHFVTVTYNSADTSYKVYIDGVNQPLSLLNSGSGIISDNGGVLYIGNRLAGDRTFNGQIDDVRIYSYPLTVQQVQTVMNNGAAVKFTQ